jgi:hypothetical protein
MEADWLVEIGSDLSVIDAAWNGFVDLRSSPGKIDEIEEARKYPALREALLALNGPDSPFFTTKCDRWRLTEAEIDPDEFSATRETARTGCASYIDVVEPDPLRFASFKLHEHWGREIASSLRQVDLFSGRVDIVLRAAVLSELNGFGLTIYAAGCGATEAEACAAWKAVLASAVAATIAAASHPPHTGE